MTQQGRLLHAPTPGKWGWVALAIVALYLGMPASAQPPADQAPGTGSAPAPTHMQMQTLAPAPTNTSATPNGAATASSSDPSLPLTPAMGGSLLAPMAAVAASAPTPANTSSAWPSLSKRQKQALAPLAAQWHALTPQQRQKWLALSNNFFQLSDEEQLTLHSRMREWAALSPRQRSQARFHFNTTQSLSAQDKRAQWEAYQALSEQEKNKLSFGLKTPVKSAARSFAPPSNRLVSPPLLPLSTTRAVQWVAPSKPIHPKTLLPQPS